MAVRAQFENSNEYVVSFFPSLPAANEALDQPRPRLCLMRTHLACFEMASAAWSRLHQEMDNHTMEAIILTFILLGSVSFPP